MAVSGVQSVVITRLAHTHAAQPAADTNVNLAQGFLVTGTNEVIRLDNDRNFPENGILSVRVLGEQV
jgi:hypothetical protein